MRKFLLFILFLLLLAALAFGLVKYNIIPNPLVNNPIFNPIEVEEISLLEAVRTNDLVAISEQLAKGVNINEVDETGKTALMYAAIANNFELMKTLIAAGADINAQDSEAWSVLMHAAKNSTDTAPILYLLNSAADPTVLSFENESVLDVASSVVRNSALGLRLEQLINNPPFDRNWPSAYVVPVEGATVSSRSTHLPGARRAYRNGIHEGFDFYSGVVSVEIVYGTPIHAVANGKVIRADHAYIEMSEEEYDSIIDVAKSSLSTPNDILDKLRGRQVWIEHAGGFISRYAHLSAIPDNVTEGVIVIQGSKIGETGNSGTLEAVQNTQDDPHPHVEIWHNNRYLGDGLEPEQIYKLARQVFGEDAVSAVNK